MYFPSEKLSLACCASRACPLSSGEAVTATPGVKTLSWIEAACPSSRCNLSLGFLLSPDKTECLNEYSVTQLPLDEDLLVMVFNRMVYHLWKSSGGM